MSGEIQIGDDGWTEIVGEQYRGGTPAASSLTPVLGRDQAMQILGALVAQGAGAPAFMNYAEKRAAASRPMTQNIPLQKARDWNIDFGPVSGAASTTSTISVAPQCLFRGEKVMATDWGANAAGYNTRVQNVFVGQRLQRPANSGATLTAFFAQNALGNGIKWDTCDKALSIAVTVSFITAATFEMSVFGKAVL